MKALVLSFLAIYATAASAQSYSPAVDKLVEEGIARSRVPGVSIAIVREGKVEYAKGYGLANVELNVPATAATVYEIGSVTKQFTAAVVLQLVQEGKVKLDEPARTYLPTMPEAWSNVTVRQLLTHTSGIKSYTDIDGFEKKTVEPVDEAGFYKYVEAQPFDFAPGDKWSYNNTGYFLLGLLIEKIEKKPYREALKSRIFAPLGMSTTFVDDNRQIVKGRASGYSVFNGQVLRAEYLDMSWPYAAGAMVTNVLDLAKWDAALYGDSVLKQSTWRQAWTPVKLNSGASWPYGFGWSFREINGVSVVEHGGGINGFISQFTRFPSKKLTIIVLTNGEAGLASSLANGIAAIVDPSLKEREPAPAADTDKALTATHQKVLEAALANKLDQKDFTPELWAKISPQAAQVATGLSQLGPLKTFGFMSEEKKEGTLTRIYRALLGETKINVTISQGTDGKISGFTIRPAG